MDWAVGTRAWEPLQLCVRKFEEGWNGDAVAVACGFDILYTIGGKKSSKGSSSGRGKIVKKGSVS